MDIESEGVYSFLPNGFWNNVYLPLAIVGKLKHAKFFDSKLSAIVLVGNSPRYMLDIFSDSLQDYDDAYVFHVPFSKNKIEDFQGLVLKPDTKNIAFVDYCITSETLIRISEYAPSGCQVFNVCIGEDSGKRVQTKTSIIDVNGLGDDFVNRRGPRPDEPIDAKAEKIRIEKPSNFVKHAIKYVINSENVRHLLHEETIFWFLTALLTNVVSQREYKVVVVGNDGLYDENENGCALEELDEMVDNILENQDDKNTRTANDVTSTLEYDLNDREVIQKLCSNEEVKKLMLGYANLAKELSVDPSSGGKRSGGFRPEDESGDGPYDLIEQFDKTIPMQYTAYKKVVKDLKKSEFITFSKPYMVYGEDKEKRFIVFPSGYLGIVSAIQLYALQYEQKLARQVLQKFIEECHEYHKQDLRIGVAFDKTFQEEERINILEKIAAIKPEAKVVVNPKVDICTFAILSRGGVADPNMSDTIFVHAMLQAVTLNQDAPEFTMYMIGACSLLVSHLEYNKRSESIQDKANDDDITNLKKYLRDPLAENEFVEPAKSIIKNYLASKYTNYECGDHKFEVKENNQAGAGGGEGSGSVLAASLGLAVVVASAFFGSRG